MANLELIGLSRKYGRDTWGLHPTDLKVSDQEFVVLLGPSGCGKSTTIRLIAGLDSAYSGKIIIGDRDVTNLPPRKRDISMVFQNYAVWPHMTVYDNIAFPLKLRKTPKAKIDSIVKDMSDLVNIGSYVNRYPAQLSGGQRQRVALARALAVAPDVFLMDEPLSNLDALLRAQMRTELKTIHQKAKATTLFVTHDQAEALSMADRIVVMKDGRIMQIGEPDDVYSRSANMFVAGFLGSPPTNFLSVEIIRENDKLLARHATFDLPLSEVANDELPKFEGKRVVLGARPENILTTDATSARFTLPAIVVEPQGSHQILVVKMGDELVKVLAPAHPKVKEGETVSFRFALERLSFFDPETEERIGQ